MDEFKKIIEQLPEDKLIILLNYAEELLLASEENPASQNLAD